MSTSEIGPYTHWHDYSSFVAAVDPDDANWPAGKQIIRGIHVLTHASTGVLEVVLADGTTKAATIASTWVGDYRGCFDGVTVASITTNTTLGAVRVYW